MKVIIATGGTGGHLFPALQVAAELKQRGCEVFFVGSFAWGVGKRRLISQGFSFEDLDVQGFPLDKPQRYFRAIGLMVKAVAASWNLLKKWKPDAVVGFGGYGSFPAVFAAVLLRYPTLIHEQNVVPGRANALLAKFVRKIAVSFPQTAVYFKPDKTILTGCPCCVPREGLKKEEVFKWFHLAANKVTILVLGGSQGSHRLNADFMTTAKSLKGQLNFQVIHICGREDYSELKRAYAQLGVPFALFEFLDNMDYAYTVADLVIARAGAVTVSEIVMFHLLSILIPYPYAGGHQKRNAAVLCEARVARLIEEKHLSPEELKKNIFAVINGCINPKQIEERLQNLRFPYAAQRMAEEAMALTR